MKHIRVSLSFVLLVCSFSVFPGDTGYSEDVSAAINAAEKSRLEAKQLGFEWSTTSILIRKAMTAAENGNESKAITLAEKALKESQNSIEQAKYAAENWRKFAL